MTKTVTAIFETRTALEDALRKLETLGIAEKQIGVVMSDQTHGKSFKLENHNKVDQGVAAGATFGVIAGGILAAVAGAGSLIIPGLNLIAVGSIVSGLAGAGAGAVAGGLVGGLVGLGVPEHEAKLYEGGLKTGHILLAVEATDGKQADRILDLLKNAEAFNIAA
jgi:hypothetical protein